METGDQETQATGTGRSSQPKSSDPLECSSKRSAEINGWLSVECQSPSLMTRYGDPEQCRPTRRPRLSTAHMLPRMSSSRLSGLNPPAPSVITEPIELLRDRQPWCCAHPSLGWLEHRATRRYISRVKLIPGQPPPRFVGEDRECSLERNVPSSGPICKAIHGKVIMASYLLEQLTLTVLGSLSIFGDAISDVYMAHSLYNDSFFVRRLVRTRLQMSPHPRATTLFPREPIGRAHFLC
jgi:hypothetical protein